MKSTQTFELSVKDIETAVTEFIESRCGKDGSLRVYVSVAVVSVGHGMSETDTHVVKVTATREIV